MVDHALSAAEQLDVVQDYLDALLRDVTENLPDISEPASIDLPDPVWPGPVDADGDSPAPVAAAVAQRPVAVLPAAVCQQPAWSERPFACLLFEVDGLAMAAPLHELGGICTIDGKIQAVVGQAPWFMGLLRWNGRNLRVVDTALLLTPERARAQGHREGYRSVIVLGDSAWALAVNRATQSVRLNPADVRWRAGNPGRVWQSGTLLESLSALLDTATLITMLDALEYSAPTE